MNADVGLELCSRYAFAPNLFHYCGPEKQSDLLGYITEKKTDRGLTQILSQFDTLYKYLVLIASENTITDPFDIRVVEAYWLGNALTLNVKKSALVTHVDEALSVRKKMKSSEFLTLATSLMSHGMPTHTDHVLSIYIRTGHHAITHTLNTMDQCRISWGKVVSMDGTTVLAQVQSLMYENESLQLGMPQLKTLSCVDVTPSIGDWVSIHWGYVCAVLTPVQLKNLRAFTLRALRNTKKNVLL
jgi:hydrogenase maturation factor